MNLINKKSYLIIAVIICIISTIFAQEALKSTEEEYYEFLSLTGETERPTLGYRTLSDSVWTVNEDSTANVWSNNNLGTTFTLFTPKNSGENWYLNGINQSIKMRIYGPEWFNSYNTAAPYGQNDGALWQGRGYNTSLTAGIRFEGYGIEATFKPQLSFSQNLSFEMPTSAYSGANYSGKADTYGYYGVTSVDAPQRFGDKAFFTFDWGDTEIRYTWRNFTTGFGTQAIWLGPAQINPILHSNNAASYPKLDIGLRKTKLIMPWTGWNLGTLEARTWWGYLSESEYFDNDIANDNNLITGLSISYGVPFLSGLTVGLNRTMLSKWDAKNFNALFTLLWPFIDTDAGYDENDQRASVIIDYLFPAVGMNIYFEWAINDYLPNYNFVIQWPFHTATYTFGVQKEVSFNEKVKGKLLLEITNIECSRDYGTMIGWFSTFYAHSIITQGYTNKGQWLGAGIGTGGNSQYLGLKLYSSNWYSNIFIQRRNPDMDYTWYIDSVQNGDWVAHGNVRVILSVGIDGGFFINTNNLITSGFVFNYEQNPQNKSYENRNPVNRINISFKLGYKYQF